MSISTEELLGALGKPTAHPELQALLARLGVDAPDGVADVPAPSQGVTLFFVDGTLADVQFSARGFDGGPPFQGELPHGLAFSHSRVQVKQQLGAPSWTSPLGVPNDRWELGDRYLTVDFSKDESRIKKVTVGLSGR